MTLAADGAVLFSPTPATRRWARAAYADVAGVICNPDDYDVRHGKTWMVGLDVLNNDGVGTVAGVPLAGPWSLPPATPLHRAQVSVVYPGYPQRDPGQSEANHRFRVLRDAAHMDGLLPEGPQKRRYARELHAYILGISLNSSAGSPTVYWQGSHDVMGTAIRAACANQNVSQVDLTDVYAAARRTVFETCARVEIPSIEGASVLMHRFTLHGTAPWNTEDMTPRAVAFFRPEVTQPNSWLTAP